MPFQDHGFDNPQIEVLSESPRLEMLQARLRQAGLRPVRAAIPLDPARAEPLLLDTLTISSEQMRSFALDCAQSDATRLLVVLGAVPEALAALSILHLKDVDQIPTLLTRLSIRQREVRRQREHGLRSKTASKLGLQPNEGSKRQSHRILYLGESSLRFAPLRAALSNNQVDTVAALSQYTAQDYLSTGRFDAIVLHPQAPDDEAAKYLARFTPLAQNGSLKLFLIEEPGLRSQLPPSQAHKVTSLLDATDAPETIAIDIASHLSNINRDVFRDNRLGSRAHEQGTDLYTRPFLEAHLDTQFSECEATGEALSLLTVSITNNHEEFKKVAAIVDKLLRDTDLAARLNANLICISLPATPYRGAVRLARRIEAAYDGQLEWRAVERRRFHTIETLLAAVQAKPGQHALRSA